MANVAFSRYVDILCEKALARRFVHVSKLAAHMSRTVEERIKKQNQPQPV